MPFVGPTLCEVSHVPESVNDNPGNKQGAGGGAEGAVGKGSGGRSRRGAAIIYMGLPAAP